MLLCTVLGKVFSIVSTNTEGVAKHMYWASLANLMQQYRRQIDGDSLLISVTGHYIDSFLSRLL